MAFNSWGFFVFIALTAAIYFLVTSTRRWLVLLVASYFFYLYASWRACVFLLFTTVSTYAAARYIASLEADWKLRQQDLAKTERKQLQEKTQHQKRAVLAACMVLNFGLLFLLKYLNTVFNGLNTVFGCSLPGLRLLLPLGISFYMFQSAGYVVDVYRGQAVAERNLLRFALFVSFFPQLVQGPISRYGQLAEQLYQGHDWDWEQARDGVQLMLWGYFKKVALADVLAVGVNQVFTNYDMYGGLFIFCAAVGYGLQVYCDFSGGIDVARGVAWLFGIRLTENFRRPYFAVSIADFWRRWHITLGAWMKDYLFYPMALSKPLARLGRFCRKHFPGHLGKTLPTCLVTLVVFIIVGMWHGSSLKYIAYGIWNGVFIIGGMLLAPYKGQLRKRLKIDENSLPLRLVQIITTFIVVGISRYFSRASSLRTALAMLKRTIAVPGLSQLKDGTWATLGWSKWVVLYLAVALLILFLVGLWQERGISLRAWINAAPPLLQRVILIIAVVVVMWFGMFSQGYTASEFIYMKF